MKIVHGYLLSDGSLTTNFTNKRKALAEGKRLAAAHDRRVFMLQHGKSDDFVLWRDGKRVK